MNETKLHRNFLLMGDYLPHLGAKVLNDIFKILKEYNIPDFRKYIGKPIIVYIPKQFIGHTYRTEKDTYFSAILNCFSIEEELNDDDTQEGYSIEAQIDLSHQERVIEILRKQQGSLEFDWEGGEFIVDHLTVDICTTSHRDGYPETSAAVKGPLTLIKSDNISDKSCLCGWLDCFIYPA